MNTAALKRSQKSFAFHDSSVTQQTLLLTHGCNGGIIWNKFGLPQKILKFISKGLVLLHLFLNGIKAVRTQQDFIFITKTE